MREIAILIYGVVLGVAFVYGSAWAPPRHATASPVHSEPLSFRDEMFAGAAPTVRKMMGSSGACSAVVVAPNLALTAQHCAAVGPMEDTTVDGHHVASARRYSKKDAMLLSVPGLLCPCAPVANAPAAIGEEVGSIGYPMAIGLVVAVGRAQGTTMVENVAYTMHTAYSGPGMSGGGLFVRREGKTQLVALTSRGVEGVFTLSTDVSWMQPEHLKMPKARE